MQKHAEFPALYSDSEAKMREFFARDTVEKKSDAVFYEDGCSRLFDIFMQNEQFKKELTKTLESSISDYNFGRLMQNFRGKISESTKGILDLENGASLLEFNRQNRINNLLLPNRRGQIITQTLERNPDLQLIFKDEIHKMIKQLREELVQHLIENEKHAQELMSSLNGGLTNGLDK